MQSQNPAQLALAILFALAAGADILTNPLVRPRPAAALGAVADDIEPSVKAFDAPAPEARVRAEAVDGIRAVPEARTAFEGFDLRTRQRKLDPVPGSKLTPEIEKYVTPGVHGNFSQYPIGAHGDQETKLLWTIDDQGAHFVPENKLEWDSSRKMPSHTNMSDTAYFGGEAWRTGPNEITINAGSGAFGYNQRYAETLTGEALEAYKAEMQARFDRAAEYFKQLGFEVKQIPVDQR